MSDRWEKVRNVMRGGKDRKKEDGEGRDEGVEEERKEDEEPPKNGPAMNEGGVQEVVGRDGERDKEKGT